MKFSLSQAANLFGLTERGMREYLDTLEVPYTYAPYGSSIEEEEIDKIFLEWCGHKLNELVTPSEAAQALQISRSEIYARIRTGELPTFTIALKSDPRKHRHYIVAADIGATKPTFQDRRKEQVLFPKSRGAKKGRGTGIAETRIIYEIVKYDDGLERGLTTYASTTYVVVNRGNFWEAEGDETERITEHRNIFRA